MTTVSTPVQPFKDPEETDVIPFDFTGDLNPGETISDPVVTCEVYAGVDPAPAVLSGTPTADVGVVTQRVTGGVADVDYRIQCVVETSDGRVLVLATILPVREA